MDRPLFSDLFSFLVRGPRFVIEGNTRAKEIVLRRSNTNRAFRSHLLMDLSDDDTTRPSSIIGTSMIARRTVIKCIADGDRR